MAQGETYFASTPDESPLVADNINFVALNIYQEFERMIKKYDADVVKDLMPLVVSVLESLNQTTREKHTFETELELLKTDNEQLLIQYEKEKQLKKQTDQKCIELEDLFEAERRQFREKLDAAESNMRLLEIKAKNAQHNVSKLEEKESDTKKEFLSLHDRYTELLKTHMDYIERMRLSTSERSLTDLSNVSAQKPEGSPRPIVIQTATVHAQGELPVEVKDVNELVTDEAADVSTPRMNLKEELLESDVATQGDAKLSVSVSDEQSTSMLDTSQNYEEDDIIDIPNTSRRQFPESNTSVFAELSVHDTDVLGEIDLGSDLTAVSREVEHLLKENNELLVRKNALNVVNKDLIVRLDDMAGEQEMLKSELQSMQVARDRLKERITELEEELAAVKEELHKQKEAAAASAEEADEERAQRKRFTRVEMARVVTERNQYKERLMELQEAVRWTEMMRVSREHPELATDTAAASTAAAGSTAGRKRTTIWNMFSSLLPGATSAGGSPSRTPSTPAKTQIV